MTKVNTKISAKESNQAPKEINPPHYVINVRDVHGKMVQIQTVDLIESLCPQDAHLAHAYTYLTRAGRKSSASYVSDVTKCAWWCIRAAKFHGGHPELGDI